MADDDEEGPGHISLFPKLKGEARREALSDPGPTWSEWFYRSFVRAWMILLYLVFDVFLITAFGTPLDLPALVFSLALGTYGQFLLYQYLWHTPSTRRHHRAREAFRPTWLHPVEYGRWTEEAVLVRAGRLPAYDPDEPAGPDPREFL